MISTFRNYWSFGLRERMFTFRIHMTHQVFTAKLVFNWRIQRASMHATFDSGTKFRSVGYKFIYCTKLYHYLLDLNNWKIRSGKERILSWFIERLRATFKDSKKVFYFRTAKMMLPNFAQQIKFMHLLASSVLLAPYDVSSVKAQFEKHYIANLH